MKRYALAAALAIAALARSAPATADAYSEAEVLFDQGIKDMKAGNFEKACPELQASLERVKDSGTKGALARCHGLAGRVASSWVLWRDLADTAPTDELRADAAAQASKLEPRIPHYVLRLVSPASNISVSINGRVVATNVIVPMPIDPGTVSVRATRSISTRSIPDVWTKDYTVSEGQQIEIVVPPFDAPAAPTAPILPTTARTMPSALPPSSDEISYQAERARRRQLADTLAYAAVGSLSLGITFGLAARTKYSEAQDACGGNINRCPAEALDNAKSSVSAARDSATAADVFFVAAGIAAIAAAFEWYHQPAPPPVALAPAISPSSVGVAISGAF